MPSIQPRDVAEARELAVIIEKQETVTNSLVSKVRVIITPVAENVDFENDFICSSTDWTKLQDGNGSVYKDFTENTSNFAVSLEYASSTTLAYWYQYDGKIDITEIGQMRYTKINWKAPTKVKDAYATLTDGTEIPVTPAQYSGDTPITVQTLKYIDDAIAYLFQNGTGGGSGVSGEKFPIGSIVPYAGKNAPEGFLLANGQAVSRTEYAELFDVCGVLYGEGDGNTTFNLPNLSGRVPLGNGTFDNAHIFYRGSTGGEYEHKLLQNEIPPLEIFAPALVSGGNMAFFDDKGTTGSGLNTTPIGKTKLEDNQPHNNIQPFLVTNFIIKAKNI